MTVAARGTPGVSVMPGWSFAPPALVLATLPSRLATPGVLVVCVACGACGVLPTLVVAVVLVTLSMLVMLLLTEPTDSGWVRLRICPLVDALGNASRTGCADCVGFVDCVDCVDCVPTAVPLPVELLRYTGLVTNAANAFAWLAWTVGWSVAWSFAWTVGWSVAWLTWSVAWSVAWSPSMLTLSLYWSSWSSWSSLLSSRSSRLHSECSSSSNSCCLGCSGCSCVLIMLFASKYKFCMFGMASTTSGISGFASQIWTHCCNWSTTSRACCAVISYTIWYFSATNSPSIVVHTCASIGRSELGLTT